jgi:ABC-type Fe3+/spermidine/putrescine transport system ATPase subunit
MASETVLELRRVSKAFATHRAVAGVSLEIPRGEFFSLLGPSGCGKTTILRMIAGFESPTSGQVWLNGECINALPPYQRSVNTVFQGYALFPHLTVQDNVAFGLRHKKDQKKKEKKGPDDISRVTDVLKQVRLEGKSSRRPSELSGGERQRVALARAIVLQPDVLLLDEPLSALDPQLRKQVRSELRDLQRRLGVTFLFVTHDQDEALSMSDRIAVMNAGSLEQVGAPREIYARPQTRFVADFLGAMNWIGGLGVRPEAVCIAAQGRKALVTGVTYLGSFCRVEMTLESPGAESIAAQVPPGTTLTAGQSVCVTWNAEDEVHL